MSTSDSDATGASAPLILHGGKEYLVSPLTDKDFTELDEWIQARVIKNAMNALPPLIPETKSIRSEILEAAMRASVGMSWMTLEGNRVLETPQGVARIAWAMIRKNDPSITMEECLLFTTKETNIIEISRLFRKLNSVLFEGDSSGNGENSSGNP